MKLNQLDGVYYCDIRPNMVEDPFLSAHIQTIDHFFYNDFWVLLNKLGKNVGEVIVTEAIEEIKSVI